MNYQLMMQSGDIHLELSKETVDAYIRAHFQCGSVRFLDYLYDEAGDVCGICGSADLGHGYGFSNGFQEFTLRFGETYAFSHDYTSVEGPTDWEDGSFRVALKLIRLDEDDPASPA